MNGQFAALVCLRVGKKDGAGYIGPQRALLRRQKGGVRVFAILHAGLVAAHQWRRYALDKREIAHFFVAHQRLAENLGRFLVGLAGVVNLQVFFGGIMGIADPAIDEICLFGDDAEPLQLSGSENIFDLSKYESLHFLVRVVYHWADAAPTDGKALKSS